jgi:transcriptional regulator with XRE-family HTH domain
VAIVADDPLDIEALARALRKRRRGEGLGLREAARQAEVPPTTFSRVEEGRLPDLATYRRLVSWLGVSSDAFMQSRRVRLDSTPEIIAEHLRTDQNLSPAAATRIADLVAELYNALVTPVGAPVAMHLRAAKTFEPSAMELLGSLLDDMQRALVAQSED